MELTKHQIETFREVLWSYYGALGRTALPWRQTGSAGSFDPYHILVSELMLQQTQVARVIPKYEAFLQHFPTIHSLAEASLGNVLRAWQGLGYNRRAKFLWQAAQAIDTLGTFPNTLDELVKLPGIGPNTAGAIVAYAFDKPVVYVETNVRTVYIHHFYKDATSVSDKDILNLVGQTLDHENPRKFYWALMDYGTHLKATVGNLNKASKHYTKQSKFEGSARQIRGQVIRLLGEKPYALTELETAIPDPRLLAVLQDLLTEKLVMLDDNLYKLS